VRSPTAGANKIAPAVFLRATCYKPFNALLADPQFAQISQTKTGGEQQPIAMRDRFAVY
jgi:hypothetical protein